LAQSRRMQGLLRCLLLGVNRTQHETGRSSAYGPDRTYIPICATI
jgi:hypothetical protein